jgi:hypothetical protein
MAIVLTEQKDIGRQLITVASKLVDIKTGNRKGEKSDLYFGFAMGLMYALGKAEGFRDTDNMLGYINSVISEIFNDELPLEMKEPSSILH